MRATLLIAATAAVLSAVHAAHRQTQLKEFFEVFELETMTMEEGLLSDDCLGTPFLYVTFGHRGESSVSKYTRDGCFISDKILVGGPDSELHLRSMALDEEGELLIANADDKRSQILVYGACENATNAINVYREEFGRSHNLSNGQRKYKGIVIDSQHNPAAVHPYGIALDAAQARESRRRHLPGRIHNLFAQLLRYRSRMASPISRSK
jgi:hypothetical protein